MSKIEQEIKVALTEYILHSIKVIGDDEFTMWGVPQDFIEGFLAKLDDSSQSSKSNNKDT